MFVGWVSVEGQPRGSFLLRRARKESGSRVLDCSSPLNLCSLTLNYPFCSPKRSERLSDFYSSRFCRQVCV